MVSACFEFRVPVPSGFRAGKAMGILFEGSGGERGVAL